MNQHNLLIARKVFPSTMGRLTPHFQIHANEADVIRPREEFIALASQADALFISGGERIDRALLEQCPRVRMIATGTVGFNHIDLAALSLIHI